MLCTAVPAGRLNSLPVNLVVIHLLEKFIRDSFTFLHRVHNTSHMLARAYRKEKSIYFRLSSVATRRGGSSVKSGHRFRHSGYIFVSLGTRVRHGKVKDRYGVLARRQLVCYVHSQMSGGVLWSCTSDR